MVLKVRRFDPGSGRVWYDFFDIRPKPGRTVLSALLFVQDRLDDSLAFRHSCRGAVCGSCAMLINKVPRLACRTQLDALLDGSAKLDLQPYPAVTVGEGWKARSEVLVEPLPHLHVLRDLVVDMGKFFSWYRVVKPRLRSVPAALAREPNMEPGRARELETYANCVLCAACVGACPANGRNPNYLGPAALAKLYRFARDPREPADDSRLLFANHPDGWWGCKFYLNCTKVCPKKVPPSRAIGTARQRLKELGLAPADALPTPQEFLPAVALVEPAGSEPAPVSEPEPVRAVEPEPVSIPEPAAVETAVGPVAPVDPVSMPEPAGWELVPEPEPAAIWQEQLYPDPEPSPVQSAPAAEEVSRPSAEPEPKPVDQKPAAPVSEVRPGPQGTGADPSGQQTV
jgi:succinate dehydrogenase / fumarate reductase iron-sulfur subunit